MNLVPDFRFSCAKAKRHVEKARLQNSSQLLFGIQVLSTSMIRTLL